MKTEKFGFPFFQMLILAFLSISCSSDSNKPREFQYLVSAKRITDVTVGEIKERAGVLAEVVFNEVLVYKLVYNTRNLDGSPIMASGLVLFPNNLDSLTILSLQHGTILTQEEAPSSYLPVGNMEAYLAGTLGASMEKGYLVVMPDYLGFGESDFIIHPYQHKASLASASLDMLRAAKEFATKQELPLRKGIYLAGYSEGGYASMALHEEIEATAPHEFTVLANLPGAGAYDMVSTAQWVVSQDRELPQLASTFYTWVLLTYNQMYGINIPLTEMLTPENAQKVASAIAEGDPLKADLSLNPKELFTPSFIQGITEETNSAFIQALHQNDVYDWTPKAATSLFHAPGDDIVPALNSQIALNAFRSNGAIATLVPLGNASTTHREGIQYYIAYILNMLK